MSTDELVEASPCKLRNGNWGCKTAVPVKVGDTVQITTRANKQWKAQITQVVWTDEQVCICETASEGSAPTASASKSDTPAGKRGQPRASTATATSRASTHQPASESVPASADPRDGDPAFASSSPLPDNNQPNDDLDAMADRAAAEQDDMDDWMSAMQEADRES